MRSIFQRSAVLGFVVAFFCLSREARPLQTAPQPRRIDVIAKRFTYDPAEITLKKDQPVVLALKSEDVAHGVKFSELNLQTDIAKSGTSELRFTPDHTGTFIGHCSHFCGSGHGAMTLTLHVTE